MVTLSYFVDGFFLDFAENSILLEGLLIGLSLVFLSVLGYYFFVFSMRDDRAEKKLENFSNPWDRVSGQTESQPLKTTGQPKLKIVLLAVMGVLAVLIFLLVALLLKWI